MDKVGPSPTTLLAAYIVPSAVWRVWMAEFYGPPLKAHSVSFCLHTMALADVCVAGLCSHRPASSYVTDGDEPAKALETKNTLLRCLSRHSSLVLCSCLTLQAMAPKAYLTGKSKDKVAAKKTRKKPGGPRLRRCWAELHGWSFTRSCFWGWTLAQN